MSAALELPLARPERPLSVASEDFVQNKYAYYRWLREEAPVHPCKISLVKAYAVSRYQDCVDLLVDDRFVRNRGTATGGGRFPFPLPRSVRFVAESMIIEDDPEHRRLRNLVKQAFLPRTVARMEDRVREVTQQILAKTPRGETVDLMQTYALPIPTTVISEIVGVSGEDMPRLRHSVRALSEGLSGWSILRTLLFDIGKAGRFIQELIERKRRDPQDDVLTALIQAEEEGDRLSENEIVSMVFLLIVAGYETTVHLITNGVQALLTHPDQLALLRAHPDLIESAVEEILRYCGPIHGTKFNYAREDVTLHGVPIKKGTAVIPVLGAANRDPDVFEDPDRFDITRSPNRHIAFGHGRHFCLGSQLARMEARIAISVLIEQSPGLKLAVAPEALRLQRMPLWHRFESLPVVLRGPNP